MDNKGYPEEHELEKIRSWDYKDVFEMIEYIAERWNYGDYGFKREWEYNCLFNRYELHLWLHTCGWSGNEEIIEAILDNVWFKGLWYAEWRRGGHYKFIINPFNIGFKTVFEYCKDNNVSRQYIHKIKDRFEWIIISKNKRLLRMSNKCQNIETGKILNTTKAPTI